MEEMRKQLEAAQAKRNEAFNAMLESQTDESIAKYEAMAKVCQGIQERLDAEERKVAEGRTPNGSLIEKKAPIMNEAQQFVKKIVEAVSVGTNYTGLIPTEVAAQIEKKKYEYSRFRRFCTVHKASGNYSFAVEGNGVTVSYVGEAKAISETDVTVTPVTLGAFKLAAIVKVSREALNDLAMDMLGYITETCAKGFALKEDAEILKGTGADSMTGIITAVSAVPAQIKTSASVSAFTWAELKAAIGLVKAYRPTAKLIVSQATADVIHEFKDGDKYIFDQNSPLSTVYGVPVVVSPDMAEIATGNVVAVVGDLSYYHIADREDFNIQVLNELYAGNDQVGVKAIQRIDGKVSLPEAFALLKIK